MEGLLHQETVDTDDGYASTPLLINLKLLLLVGLSKRYNFNSYDVSTESALRSYMPNYGRKSASLPSTSLPMVACCGNYARPSCTGSNCS